MVWYWLWENSDKVRDMGTVALGIVGVVLLTWRSISAGRQAKAAKEQADVAQAQINLAQRDSLYGRYQKGADMLNSTNMSTRLGGIYSLRRLAEDHPDQFHLQVMEILCAFIRKPPYLDSASKEKLREDVQTALDAVIHRSDRGIEIEEATETVSDPSRRFRINLWEADLKGARIAEAKLHGAVLNGVCMASAYGNEADLSCASMTGANLHRALFIWANFDQARMSSCDMSQAVFQDASFIDTDLGSNLSESDFSYAYMSNANLGIANLTNAQLQETDLSGAKFSEGTHVGSDPLTGKSISYSVYCRVTQAQLDLATANPDDPPDIAEGTTDIETGEPLVWNRQRCGNQWVERQRILESV